jgi:hypothetical protein
MPQGGSGGTDLGGAAGVAGAAGMAGAASARPSAGCGKQGKPSGGAVTVAGDHIYAFPEKYEGTKPLPVLFALHAYGNPYTQLQGLTNGSQLATDYVRVFPKSAGSGWVLDTDTPRLDRIFEEVRSSYCIDESRIFLTGHSSGAQMAVQLLCAGDRRFKAAAPVAASSYCQKIDALPVLYIQGKMDAQRGGGNGIDVVNFFAKSNGCAMNSEPVASIASCQSQFDQAKVTPGCIAYEGCSVRRCGARTTTTVTTPRTDACTAGPALPATPWPGSSPACPESAIGPEPAKSRATGIGST